LRVFLGKINIILSDPFFFFFKNTFSPSTQARPKRTTVETGGGEAELRRREATEVLLSDDRDIEEVSPRKRGLRRFVDLLLEDPRFRFVRTTRTRVLDSPPFQVNFVRSVTRCASEALGRLYRKCPTIPAVATCLRARSATVLFQTGAGESSDESDHHHHLEEDHVDDSEEGDDEEEENQEEENQEEEEHVEGDAEKHTGDEDGAEDEDVAEDEDGAEEHQQSATMTFLQQGQGSTSSSMHPRAQAGHVVDGNDEEDEDEDEDVEDEDDDGEDHSPVHPDDEDEENEGAWNTSGNAGLDAAVDRTVAEGVDRLLVIGPGVGASPNDLPADRADVLVQRAKGFFPRIEVHPNPWTPPGPPPPPPAPLVCGGKGFPCPVSCPPGQVQVGNSCVTPEPPACPEGFERVGNHCRLPPPPPPPMVCGGKGFPCPPGPPPPPPPAPCPLGWITVGNQCHPPPPLVCGGKGFPCPVTCPAGMVRVGDHCIEPGPAPCPTGWERVGNSCVQPLRCPDGWTVGPNRTCNPPPALVCGGKGFPCPPPACPAGTTWDGTRCAGANPPACPAGFFFDGRVCHPPRGVDLPPEIVRVNHFQTVDRIIHRDVTNFRTVQSDPLPDVIETSYVLEGIRPPHTFKNAAMIAQGKADAAHAVGCLQKCRGPKERRTARLKRKQLEEKVAVDTLKTWVPEPFVPKRPAIPEHVNLKNLNDMVTNRVRDNVRRWISHFQEKILDKGRLDLPPPDTLQLVPEDTDRTAPR
jgi:hypothetical protein